MREGNFRYASSNKELEDRIKVRMEAGADTIYWHIIFNLKLDPSTVSSKTMYVTDLGGFVLNSHITYDTETNLIVISPLETYEQNFYYILNISTKVRSEKGQNLKQPVIILFKLLENEISEMQVLPSNVKTPEPRQRPEGYKAGDVRSKVFSDNEIYGNVATDRLKTIPLKVNPVFAIIAVAITVGLSMVNLTLGAVGLGLALVAIGFLIQQIAAKKTRAIISYNSGVKDFNNGEYRSAKEKFKKAFLQDSQNETIEYALNKVDYYL